MSKQAYFILLLLVASLFIVWKVEAGEEATESSVIGIFGRKFLQNGSLLKMMGIDEDRHKEKCSRYRGDCSNGKECCKYCYCKAFTLPQGITPLCDGKTDCH